MIPVALSEKLSPANYTLYKLPTSKQLPRDGCRPARQGGGATGKKNIVSPQSL